MSQSRLKSVKKKTRLNSSLSSPGVDYLICALRETKEENEETSAIEI